MSRISPGRYAQWRLPFQAAHTLAEGSETRPFNERLLQLIWHHQRLRRDRLATTDGQPVAVFHPGFWNQEAGPDFRSAVIQVGGALARNGDVEIDLRPENWHAHGHDQNSAYRAVILHVVWEADASKRPLPTLALKSCLDAPLEELAVCLRREPGAPQLNLLGRCAPILRELSAEEATDLLRQAAHSRLETKAHHLQARARQAGWEQALWEGLFSGLGYKNNSWPMQRISESLPALLPEGREATSVLVLQARLLGVSGLLPPDLANRPSSAQAYERSIWDIWWRERERFSDLTLPRVAWHLGGNRPANHPQRRLALAAHWLADSDLPTRLGEWFASAVPGPKARQTLWEALQTQTDVFWSRHWSFRSPSLPTAQPMIGPPRVTDLAINAVLPWFWIRADLGQNDTLRRHAETCYDAWPRAEDNAVLRLARRRLFGSAVLPGRITAAAQQGLLQIVRDFCDFSNALCENCPFPELVKSGTGTR